MPIALVLLRPYGSVNKKSLDTKPAILGTGYLLTSPED